MGVIELKRKHDAAAVNSSLVRRPIRRWAPLFMGPMLCAFAIGFVYPFCKGVYLSFCKFKTTSDAQFIGFSNYIKALNDASFVHSFWYTALFALVSLVFINVLAFAVAYALTQGIKGSNLFRTVFFMPNLIGGIVLGYVWSMIFDGILSRYGTSILLETKYGFWGLIILMCWQQIGYMMIIYIAGLQAVPEDMLEAAKIDGANRWQTLWKVTIPNVMPSITICTFLTLTNIGVLGGSADISFAKGLLYLAACMPMAVIGLISAKQQAKAAVSSIALVAKRPDQFGKAMIFPAMVETYAILALLISILALPTV